MGLDVHLRGRPVGRLFAAGDNDYRFAYTPEVVETTSAGVPLLSTSLPVRAEPFGPEASRAYVGGLLPEGRARERLARRLGIDGADGYGLISALGRDCAGAVVFLPGGGAVDEDEPEGSRLGEDQLEMLASSLPPDGGMPPLSFILPGARHKLALVRDAAGTGWRLPSASAASTHVVKPESGDLPDLILNEMFCTEVARRAGLPAAELELAELGGRRCLVSRRFDREGPLRVHKEDFCQALGFPSPDDATDLDESFGPDFAEACGLLRAVGRDQEISLLIALALFNYVIGNGDAHGANLGLLHDGGASRLAPFHDLTSTVVYGLPTHVGMVISEDYDQGLYLLEMGWVSEESDFDFDEMRALASRVAARVLDALEPVADGARAHGWHAPIIDDIVALASERATGLGYEVDY